MMKNNSFILTVMFCVLALAGYAQKWDGIPIHNDTTFVIVDTTQTYLKVTKYVGKTIKRELFNVVIYNQNFTWSKGGIRFVQFDSAMGYEYNNTPKLTVAKKKIGQLYFMATDKQINSELTHQLTIDIGGTPWSKYNYFIFKEDFDAATDSVMAHRVHTFFMEGHND